MKMIIVYSVLHEGVGFKWHKNVLFIDKTTSMCEICFNAFFVKISIHKPKTKEELEVLI